MIAYLTKKFPVHGKDGTLLGVGTIATDITERKRAEENLNLAHEKLLVVLDSIDSTVYVADMETYEILFMNKKMITDFGGDKTGEKCFKAFREKSEPCEFCTNNQLIDGNGNPADICTWHDQNPITGKIHINHDRAIEWIDGRLVRLQCTTDITDLKKIDPSQIDQILANLCVNARDAIKGVGKLTMETGMKSFDEDYCRVHPGFIPGDFVILTVSDNGCGMDKETLKNIFEPFFTTKDVDKGTGLGLATVYGIVNQNKGFINVYSEPDHGSTFRIYLPRWVATGEEPKIAFLEKPFPRGNEIILLVEDEPMILKMAGMMLERQGYTVLSAATPAEAMVLAQSHPSHIHLLMTDVIMPEMNGRDLAAHLTSLYPDLKLLFMSGYTANVIADQGILDKDLHFIQKPFSMKELAGKVRGILDANKING